MACSIFHDILRKATIAYIYLLKIVRFIRRVSVEIQRSAEGVAKRVIYTDPFGVEAGTFISNYICLILISSIFLREENHII